MKSTRSTKSSGNVFADIGVPDADEHIAKADLVIGILRSSAQGVFPRPQHR
jgi:hypothetical protein